ncbi:MAG: DUF4307 domain-containing protein [Actinomycetota bacterium]|nr:MAG: DUF4307 domain-containing protein [Actinomycetota bacterium]
MTRTDLPANLRLRYGVRGRPAWVVPVIVMAVAILVGAGGLVALRLTDQPVRSTLLTWRVVAADRVDVTFEVRRPADQPVVCVLRAQDADHVDVGYAELTLPAGTAYEQPTFRLRTLAPAFAAEVLGCGAGARPRDVPPPQFPPGVAPPPQPWAG